MDLFESIDPYTTLITPNRRLSAILAKKHQYVQQQQQKTCWNTLDVLPFNSWITRLWHDYTASHIAAHPIILSPEQQHLLWESIIKQSPDQDALLQITASAETARSAWMTLKQWQVPNNHPLLGTTEDNAIFLTWARQYQEQCHANQWLDEVMLVDLIAEKIQQSMIPVPQKIIAIGFTEFSPQQTHLFNCLERAGCIVIKNPVIHPRAKDIKRLSLIDEESEIHAMARWAKNRYDESKKYSIGCIIPNLEKIRDRVISIFSSVFTDKTEFTLNYTTLPFNISAGKSLNSYPIIHAALTLLQLNTEVIPFEMQRFLLRSPFIIAAERERMTRAQLIVQLQQKNTQSLTIDAFEKALMPYAPILAKHIKALGSMLQTLPKRMRVKQWLDIAMELLTCMGWPGERSVNSQEYQVITRWLEMINQFESQDSIIKLTRYHEILHYFNVLATHTIFQPQSPEAPIQILGLLEAADIGFDYTWIMGLDDTTWPPAAKPNPFIPHRLQTLLSMPHATAERELTYSARLMEQLTANAEQCIISHPTQSTDCELRPSALITHLESITIDALRLSSYTPKTQTIYQSQRLERIYDDRAPSLSDNELIRGGVSILKQQAACPFKAFAEIRLQAKPIESIRFGLRPQDRGQIVHLALDLFWKKIQHSEQLHSLTIDELQREIREVSVTAIEKITGDCICQKRYYELECQRLSALLFDWMMIEKKRPPFQVIAHEKEQSITIGQLPITTRVDRIDELADGTRIIIDYKTGKENQINAWFSDRPDEPQLPLYCITSHEPISGIAFAQLNRHELVLKGIADVDIGIPTIRTLDSIEKADHHTWQQQLTEWHQVLNNLSEQFYQGHAEINPKDTLITCQFCMLQGFCRKHEVIEESYE